MTVGIVIGESHVACIENAALKYPALLPGLEVHRLSSPRRPNLPGTISIDCAEAKLKELPSNRPTFLYMMGTYHNIIGLLRTEPDFDFLFSSTETDFNSYSVIVPRAIISQIFKEHLSKSASAIRLSRAAPGRVYLLGTPPPKCSNEFIMNKFESMVKKQYNGKNVPEVGINRPELRLKFWKIEQQELRSWCKDHDIQFIPSPLLAQIEGGFLREEFYGDDATHANVEYGKLWIESIRDLITSCSED